MQKNLGSTFKPGKKQKEDITKGGKGAVYTRWGRKSCPADNNTQLVYSGYVGGSFYTSPGGAANPVCMPDNPTWGSHGNIKPRYPAYLYGAEYKDTEIFGMADFKEDVPCTVCRSSAHSTLTMIPGRTDCYPGWSEAYNGLLTAGYPSHTAPSEYVCMDGHPEAMIGGGRLDDYGYLFYSVLAKCGSLPCPPYENNKVLSCVVCMM